jgi:serine/threonine-protein kinase RsbW
VTAEGLTDPEWVPPLVRNGIAGNGRALVDARRALSEWAVRARVAPSDADDLVHAAYEAMANAAEHAYGDEPGEVDLKAACTREGHVLVTVRDHGAWRPPPRDPGLRGRGLIMIRAMAHHVRIEHGADGTTVHMWWRRPG